MRKIDLENWPRRTHFELFREMAFPHFSLTTIVDLSNFYPYLKKQGVSFTIGMMYLLAKTANQIPEFRYRIRGETVIEHETIHPSCTILTDDNLFAFCSVRFSEDFQDFAARAAELITLVKTNPTLDDSDWADSLLFMTSLPWISFTSMHHPNLSTTDSVPRVAWGKYSKEADKIRMPLNIQAHHGLIDGLHVGQFFNQFQNYLNTPEKALSMV
jgi:chloramphenicol O-acetyltransferase type A